MGGGFVTGGVLQKSGGSRGQGRGRLHTRHRTSKRNAEHLGREWSNDRGGTPLLEGGLRGLPQDNFSNSPMKW